MKKISSKIVAIILITVFAVLIIPTKGFASNENIQIVKTNEDYIIYVKDMANKEFKFAVSNEKLNSDSMDLKFINSVKDGAENNVALLKEKAKAYDWIGSYTRLEYRTWAQRRQETWQRRLKA